MKKLLAVLLVVPSLATAKCDNIKGEWIGKSVIDNTIKPYSVDIGSYKDVISVTELQPERAELTIRSTYRINDCQMEFLMWNTERGNASVILNFTNQVANGFIDDNKGRHFLELTR